MGPAWLDGRTEGAPLLLGPPTLGSRLSSALEPEALMLPGTPDVCSPPWARGLFETVSLPWVKEGHGFPQPTRAQAMEKGDGQPRRKLPLGGVTRLPATPPPLWEPPVGAKAPCRSPVHSVVRLPRPSCPVTANMGCLSAAEVTVGSVALKLVLNPW